MQEVDPRGVLREIDISMDRDKALVLQRVEVEHGRALAQSAGRRNAAL